MLGTSSLPAAFCCLIFAPVAVAQTTTEVLVDFGHAQYPTGAAGGSSWNDIESGTQATPLALVDRNGAPTGAVLTVLPGSAFLGANTAGTTTTQPGSAYAQLGFPSTVTRDVMYGGNGATVRLQIDGLDPTALHEITFTASRTNVTDDRTTDYIAQGFNGGIDTLNASNNVSEIARVCGVLPDAAGKITIDIRAAASNTNPVTRYFYLGGMRIVATSTGQLPNVLAFAQPFLDVSRPAGGGVFATTTTLRERTGATPIVTFTAVDVATARPPAWLRGPGSAQVGAQVPLQLDPSALALGSYRAVVTAQAAGYASSTMAVQLRVRDPRQLNLLFYGNSYSQGNGTMPAMVSDLAEEAGEPQPRVTAALVGGQTLAFHRTDPTQVAAIGALPLGEQWDFVVMQGHSLEATRLGNPARFRADGVGIVDNVRAHSPGARAVLFQTWARGPGHSVYPGTFAAPLQMHREIRGNYALAAGDIDSAHGAGTAARAPVGDAVALLAFDPQLYTSDLSHPTPPTSLLAGMAVFEAIYRQRVCDLTPDFSGSGKLVTRMAQLGLGAADWQAYAGIGERVAPRSVRRFPGSDEDLLLRSGAAGAEQACPARTVTAPISYGVQLTTPNAVYGAVPAIVLLSPFTTAAPPASVPGSGELYAGAGGWYGLAQATVLGPGLFVNVAIPPAPVAYSVLLQGVAFGPSSERQNERFTTTDAHTLHVR